jgi:hypothetical protein
MGVNLSEVDKTAKIDTADADGEWDPKRGWPRSREERAKDSDARGDELARPR